MKRLKNKIKKKKLTRVSIGCTLWGNRLHRHSSPKLLKRHMTKETITTQYQIPLSSFGETVKKKIKTDKETKEYGS